MQNLPNNERGCCLCVSLLVVVVVVGASNCLLLHPTRQASEKPASRTGELELITVMQITNKQTNSPSPPPYRSEGAANLEMRRRWPRERQTNWLFHVRRQTKRRRRQQSTWRRQTTSTTWSSLMKWPHHSSSLNEGHPQRLRAAKS